MLKIKTKTNTKGVLSGILCLAVALGAVVGGGVWTRVWAAPILPDVYVTIADVVVKDKIYDGDVAAEVESVELNCDDRPCAERGYFLEVTATAEFADPEVGDDKPVTVTIEKKGDWATRFILRGATLETTASILADDSGESGEGGEPGDEPGSDPSDDPSEEPNDEPGDNTGDDPAAEPNEDTNGDDGADAETAHESSDEATDEVEQSGTALTVPDTGEMAKGAEFASGNLAMVVATSVMVGMAVAAATFWTGVKILRKSQE